MSVHHALFHVIMYKKRGEKPMPSDEYLEKVTIGQVTTINGTITLCEYDDNWKKLYLIEENKIKTALSNQDIIIEHIGSTSIEGLCAKPILDILLLVDDSSKEECYVPFLEKVGYTLKIREEDWYKHRMFKGNNPEVNLHVFSKGCIEAKRMLDFRDWLRNNQEDREKYAQEKQHLASKTWKYVQHYADAKSKVVNEIFKHIYKD